MAASSYLAESTTSRLRKTFKAVMDDDDSDLPSDMDETEQDALITSITSSNESANTLYTRLFTALPLTSTLPFIWTLIHPSAGKRSYFSTVFMPCVLGITSLCLSALIMGFMPLNSNPQPSSGTQYTLSDLAHTQSARRHATSAGRGSLLGLDLPFAMPVESQGPVARYAMPLNGLISVIMALLGVLWMDAVGAGQAFWLLCFLPGVMYVVVFVVRSAMRESERGLSELRGMRGGYKGA